MNLQHAIQKAFEPTLANLCPDPVKRASYLGLIKPAGNATHGDYQANFAMPLAKLSGQKPPELAKTILQQITAPELIQEMSVAGPGFINIQLQDSFLANTVRTLAADARLGVPLAINPRTFVVDLSGPNVAKPLHVGHLRSTIIGDAIIRILRFAGHTAIGDNHLGDWGTQFGILLYGYKNHLDALAFQKDPVRELARLYIFVRKLFKQETEDDDETPTEDPVKEGCRHETAKLHAGDEENNRLWKLFMPACLDMLKPIYERLDVKIDHALGESFYNPMLPGIVEDLLKAGIAKESNGAVVVPNAKGIIPAAGETKEEPPALVRKRDGAFTYTTTDFATIAHRAKTWKPDAMLYVVDSRQALHFRTLFANAKRRGYTSDFEHVQFGSILDRAGKPFQTRAGMVVELSELLDSAVIRGREQYQSSLTDRQSHGHDVSLIDAVEIQQIAETVGIGAVKYADLSQNRTSDYKFDLEKMLSTDGNTATYMQYAYARCRAILRRGEVNEAALRANPPAVIFTTPEERALVLQLLRFPEAIEAAVADYYPHNITTYLWDLAKAFSKFFEACPVLKADTETLKQSRLLLVDLVGRTIHTALGLLGIKTVERM